jgi:hypothetical protein
MMWIARLSWRFPPRCSRWRWVLPLEAGIGAVPAWRAKCPSVSESLSAGGVADDDRGGHRPAPGLLKQLGGVGVDQAGERGEQFAFLAADLSDPLQQPFGDL